MADLKNDIFVVIAYRRNARPDLASICLSKIRSGLYLTTFGSDEQRNDLYHVVLNSDDISRIPKFLDDILRMDKGFAYITIRNPNATIVEPATASSSLSGARA